MEESLKQLLLADLCARLPYGVNISTHDGSQTMVGIICTNGGGKVYTSNMLYNISQVKPYLRPMSSMTEEEKKQTRDLWIDADTKTHATRLIDFYNKHHFDYRGLIPKGLAREAPKDMYK